MAAVEIDGSMGEGGGQVVRTAAAMSACTGRDLRVENARANRDTTGLRPQHVAALEAIAQACDGELEGVEVGAQRFSLRPGRVTGGRVRVETGTAACVNLVLQALAPLSRRIEEPIELWAEGGTDVKFAPTLAYTRHVFAPWARRVGIPIEILDAREGFYPVGGGRVRARIGPAREDDLTLPGFQRGTLETIGVRVRIADLPDDIADRIASTAASELAAEGYEADTGIERVEADCPGVVVDALASFEHTVLGANALGERGVPSETVAGRLADRLVAELASPAMVDVHLADQLVPLVVGRLEGGFRAREASSHLRTNVRVCERFIDGSIHLDDTDGEGVVVRSELV